MLSNTTNGKMIIVTAPSGAGKTTIVRYLLDVFPDLAFSVSATNRERRAHEKDGVDYYFLSTASFENKIEQDAFVEWEEVYENQYYGTLKSEIDRLWKLGKHIIFDIDVKGATNLKKLYPEQSLAIFIKPPSVEALLKRLQGRGSETPESLRKRIMRAKNELTFEDRFDAVVVNDVLENALKEARLLIKDFILD